MERSDRSVEKRGRADRECWYYTAAASCSLFVARVSEDFCVGFPPSVDVPVPIVRQGELPAAVQLENSGKKKKLDGLLHEWE